MKKSLFVIPVIFVLITLIYPYGYNEEGKDVYQRTCVKFPVVNDTDRRVIDACARIIPGEGSIFININKTKIDEYLSQNEIRKAVDVAYNMSGQNRSDEDVLIYIESGGTIIRGNSMGAAVCAAVIGEIQGYEMRDDIAVTGTIKDDGKIGNVSMVMDKANASITHGMSAIIVPAGKRYYNGTDIGQITGIEVIEASEIDEAIRHLIR